MSTETDHRRRTLFVLSGGNFAQLGTRLLLGGLVPFVLVDFSATKSEVGLALTGMWTIYALFQFPSGIIADRSGEKPLLLVGLGGATAGAVLVAFSPSLVVFGAFVLLLGAGTGLFYSPATTLSSRLFDEHGRALSTLTALGTIAGIVYPAAGSVIAARFGWRTAIALTAIVTLPVLVLSAWAVPSLPPVDPGKSVRSAVDVSRFWRLLTRPRFLYTLALATILVFVFQGFASFFPTFLVEYHGIDSGIAGVVFGVIFGLSALSQPVVGRLSDRFSRDAAIGASALLAMTGFAILLVFPTRVGLLVGSGVLGVGISWPGALQARFMDLFDEDARGYGFGLARTVYILLAASGSVVVGTLADAGGWLLGYGAIVGLLAACVLLLGVNRAAGLEL